MKSLVGRKALITGATRGIGKALTQYLLNAGVEVIGIGQDQTRMNALSQELSSHKTRFIGLTGDLSSLADVEKMCLEAQKLSDNSISILINNAGILHLDTLENFSAREIEKSFSINVFAAMLISKHFLPAMKKNKWGRIINMCSSSAYFGGGTSGHCIYSATKHALLGFSRALDEEVRHQGIRIGTVSPAGVQTEMMQGRRDVNFESCMTPEEVAEAVMFLLHAEGEGIVYEMRLWRMNR